MRAIDPDELAAAADEVRGKMPSKPRPKGRDHGPLAGIEDGRPVASDLRNMERLHDALQGKVLFSDAGAFVWSGTYWRDDKAMAEAQAHRLSNLIRQEVQQVLSRSLVESDPAVRKELDVQIEMLAKAAKAAESSHVIESALKMLRRELRVSASELNADAMVFNVLNGTIDLHDGRLLQHDPADLITKVAPVHFDPNATCPVFLRFLREVFDDNDDLVGYMRRYVGYCLTGMTREHVLSVWLGGGANGKSTLLNVILALMGDYAAPLDVGVLEMGRARDASRDGYCFFGLRLLVASESHEGMRLREGYVKTATGGDRLTGRKLYQEVFNFPPTHKLALVTNHQPNVDGTDAAIWRRINLVPFRQSFVGDQADRRLPEKLLAELPGILNWALGGCLEWQALGLLPPAEVLHATQTYRTEEDVIGQFTDEMTEADARAVTRWSEIQAAYVDWCDENGHRAVSGKMLNKRLRERWGEKAFDKNNAHKAIVKGWKLRA